MTKKVPHYHLPIHNTIKKNHFGRKYVNMPTNISNQGAASNAGKTQCLKRKSRTSYSALMNLEVWVNVIPTWPNGWQKISGSCS
jgi:hypothetical protein